MVGGLVSFGVAHLIVAQGVPIVATVSDRSLTERRAKPLNSWAAAKRHPTGWWLRTYRWDPCHPVAKFKVAKQRLRLVSQTKRRFVQP